MKLFYLILLSSTFALSGCEKEVIVVDKQPTNEQKADFEAQQKANCAALSEKVRQTKPYCKNYQQ